MGMACECRNDGISLRGEGAAEAYTVPWRSPDPDAPGWPGGPPALGSIQVYIILVKHIVIMLDHAQADLLERMDRVGPLRFRDLAKVVPNPRTLSRKLRDLRSAGWVEHVDARYRLTAVGREAVGFVRRLRVLTAPPPVTVDVARVAHPVFGPVIRRFVEELASRTQENLRGVLVFGSVARGDWDRDSDIDLLVVERAFAGDWRSAMEEIREVRRRLDGTPEVRDAVAAGFSPTVGIHPFEETALWGFHPLFPEVFTDGVIVFEADGCLSSAITAFRERMFRAGTTRVHRPGIGTHWDLGDMRVLEGG